MSSRNRRVTNTREITDPKEILLTIIRKQGACTHCSCKVCHKFFRFNKQDICAGHGIESMIHKVRVAEDLLKNLDHLLLGDEEQIILNQNI